MTSEKRARPEYPAPRGMWTGDGRPIQPGDGSVPVLRELERGRLKVVGTGFWITRYGLFVSAKHVLEELTGGTPPKLGRGYILHLAGEAEVHLRRIRAVSLSTTADLAVGQADNFVDKFPNNALMNLRGKLSCEVPPLGSLLRTYAYPENAILDFNDPNGSREIRGDFFDGEMLKFVTDGTHWVIAHPHFETSIDVRGGASGGPVFDVNGAVVGVNCRGWDFRGGEHESDPLSYILPIGELLPLTIDLKQLPPNSWEASQLATKGSTPTVTIYELGRLGHIEFSPPLLPPAGEGGRQIQSVLVKEDIQEAGKPDNPSAGDKTSGITRRVGLLRGLRDLVRGTLRWFQRSRTAGAEKS